MTAPTTCAVVEYMDRPVAWSSFSNIEKNTMPAEAIQQILKYWRVISMIWAFDVWEDT